MNYEVMYKGDGWGLQVAVNWPVTDKRTLDKQDQLRLEALLDEARKILENR